MIRERLETKDISNIIHDNSCEYSSYVLLNRAIPDLRDGMKPVHRRILYTFHKEKATSFVKSATLNGKVFKYHPHGDTYGTMVGMAQSDAQMIPWLTGKGNFAQHTSRDLQPGAMRYTELKLSEFAQYSLKDVNEKMVDFIPNFDGTAKMPEVIPMKFPTILTYCQSGIGVGMASSIPSFNMNEIAEAIGKFIDTREETILIPDFSTGGQLIVNENEIDKLNKTGKGSFKVRATYEVNGDTITITSIPYTTTREAIIESIVDLVKRGKIKEILQVNDVTGLNYMGITITVKKNTNVENLMNRLFSMTPLESAFSANMNVIYDKLPKVCGVWDILRKWISWRGQTIVRATRHEINEIEKRLNVYDGFAKIYNDLDAVVNVIRKSSSDSVISNLIEKFELNVEQAEYISNMKLRKLTEDNIAKELQDREELIDELKSKKKLISSKDEILNKVKEEAFKVAEDFGQARRTSLLSADDVVKATKEEIIEDYGCRVVYTSNYIKKHLKQSNNHKIKEGEVVLGDIVTTNKSTLLVFTNKGNRYKVPVHTLDTLTPSSMGTYIHNILSLENEEYITKIVSVEKPVGYIVNIYEDGKMAKVDISSYMSNNTKLVNCLREDSKLVAMEYIKKDVDVMFVASDSKALIIDSSLISSKKSRNTQGNTGIRLGDGCKVVGAFIDIKGDEFIEISCKGKLISKSLSDMVDESRTLYTYIKGRNGNKGNKLTNKDIESVIMI